MLKIARVVLGATIIALAGCRGQREASAGTETGAADSASAAPAPVSHELEVASVMIGKRIGENNLITEPTFQFAPQDTVYISVATTGVPDSAVLTAIWHFQTGQMIDSSSRTIQPTGAENTEFHVSRPKGWQPGTYKVTVYADGDSVEARTFAVRKQQ
jgi:hypothetical protein